MRIFKVKAFERFARKEKISDKDLVGVIEQAEEGLIEADLGGGLIKQRIARAGKGKSGGYRAIICFKQGSRAIFMFGFAKSAKDNLDDTELVAYKAAAKILLAITDKDLDLQIAAGNFTQVKGYEQKI